MIAYASVGPYHARQTTRYGRGAFLWATTLTSSEDERLAKEQRRHPTGTAGAHTCTLVSRVWHRATRRVLVAVWGHSVRDHRWALIIDALRGQPGRGLSNVEQPDKTSTTQPAAPELCEVVPSFRPPEPPTDTSRPPLVVLHDAVAVICALRERGVRIDVDGHAALADPDIAEVHRFCLTTSQRR